MADPSVDWVGQHDEAARRRWARRFTEANEAFGVTYRAFAFHAGLEYWEIEGWVREFCPEYRVVDLGLLR